MIRGIYNELDKQMREFQEKFIRDEEELRKQIDLQIKQQMCDKLKALDYSQTPKYHSDFLDVLGKCAALGKAKVPPTNPVPLLFEVEKEKTRPHTYSGFFYNLSNLNKDSSLKFDEYIIGVYGVCNVTHTSNNYGTPQEHMLSIKKIIVITNYLNIFEIINQYDNRDINLNKSFNERYQLKEVRKNDMLLFDKQIDTIVNIFQKIKIECNFSQPNCNPSNIYPYGETLYNKTYYQEIILNEKQTEFKDFSSKINFPSLPKDCLKEKDIEIGNSLLSCCQKCNRKYQNFKQTEFQKEKTNIDAKLRKIQAKKQHYLYVDTEMDDYMLVQFEQEFNNFWADKIQEISGHSKSDISMAQLIQDKDDKIDKLEQNEKTLKTENSQLKVKLSQYQKSSEYEKTLLKQIKEMKCERENFEKEKEDIIGEKNKLQEELQSLKSKLGSLLG